MLSGWLLFSLKKAGIDTTVYSGHSFRGAGASSRKANGASIESIMRDGGWRTESCLKAHYLRDIHE